MKRILIAVTVGAAVMFAPACSNAPQESDVLAASGQSDEAREYAENWTPPTTTTTTPPPPPAEPPAPEDFAVDITVVEEQCFGSAGCNVVYMIEPTYLGYDSAGRSDQYTVVYEVSGPEDGAQIGNFDVDFTTGNISYSDREMAQTSSSGTELTATVIDVLPG